MEGINAIKPILERFLKERKQIEEQAVKEGRIPKDLCELCEGGFQGKRWIIPLSEREREGLLKFLEWIRENKITFIKTRFGDVFVESVQQIGRKKPDSIEEGKYEYRYSFSEFRKRSIFKDLLRFQEIDTCPHFNFETGEIIPLRRRRREIDIDRWKETDIIFLCCKKCKEEIEKRECDDGVRKKGFIYKVFCDLDGLLLRKILMEESFKVELSEVDKHVEFPSSRQFFLREHKILIAKDVDGATISKLNPKLIVTFGNKSRIIDLLELKTDLLIVTEDGELYFYNHSKPVVKSLQNIIDKIIEKLAEYVEESRGSEHDRVVEAFERIGQELGYVSEKEHGKKGVRVDCVWYDRDGRIKVAIEVETRGGGWKKDIISTWELEPELAIIVTYQKTDSVPKALMNFALMKSLPHKLLYINMETKNAFLFEKQQILKKYSLRPEREEEVTIMEI